MHRLVGLSSQRHQVAAHAPIPYSKTERIDNDSEAHYQRVAKGGKERNDTPGDRWIHSGKRC
jgi:hypothetical protein